MLNLLELFLSLHFMEEREAKSFFGGWRITRRVGKQWKFVMDPTAFPSEGWWRVWKRGIVRLGPEGQILEFYEKRGKTIGSGLLKILTEAQIDAKNKLPLPVPPLTPPLPKLTPSLIVIERKRTVILNGARPHPDHRAHPEKGGPAR